MRALRPSSHPPIDDGAPEGDSSAKEENILRYQKLAAMGVPLFGDKDGAPRRKRLWPWLGRAGRVAPS